MAKEKKPLLDENQERVARKILETAPKYGINPDFALSIAMAENMFRDATSEKGAIGPMQLMPDTAKGLGVDPYDEDDNIKGGLMLIKQLTGDKRIGSDPIRVLAGYHSGPDLKYFETNNYADLGPNALKYIDRIGKFTDDNIPSVLVEIPKEGNGTVEVSEEDRKLAEAKAMDIENQQKRLEMGQAAGATLGAGVGIGYDLMKKPSGGALPSAAPPAPPSPPAMGRVEPSMTSQPSSQPSAQSTRIMQGGQGDPLDTTGRARQEGYNTETARRAAVANEMKATNPQAKQVLARAPGMTSSPSGVLYPSTEMRPTAGPRPQPSGLTVRGGAPYQPMPPDRLANVRPGGDPTMGSPMPQAPAPSGALPAQKPSLARQAINMGRQAMNIPVIGSGLTGALGGYSAITQAEDAAQRFNKGDYLGAGISGVGALGSAAAVIPNPLTRGVGGGLAMAAPMANMIVDYMRQSSPLSQAQTPTRR
jgi:hypothetical protein